MAICHFWNAARASLFNSPCAPSGPVACGVWPGVWPARILQPLATRAGAFVSELLEKLMGRQPVGGVCWSKTLQTWSCMAFVIEATKSTSSVFCVAERTALRSASRRWLFADRPPARWELRGAIFSLDCPTPWKISVASKAACSSCTSDIDRVCGLSLSLLGFEREREDGGESEGNAIVV